MPKINHEDCLVNPEQVIEAKDGVITLGGKLLSDAEKKRLQGEAKTLEQFQIWDIFQNTLRQQAIEMAIINSTDFGGTLAGKMMLHNLGIQKSILEILRDLKE